MLQPAQPDQIPAAWNDHVAAYEAVFEPFSLQFAERALDRLALPRGAHVLDVGAGSGGLALTIARRGATVTAVDASADMVARTAARATGLPITARVMDGQALTFADATFDAAISAFGVVLFPDAVQGLGGMRRVVRPGGRVAIVTWTEPQAYELAAALRAAAAAVVPDLPAGTLPAQLRYRDRADFTALFKAAGFDAVEITVEAAVLRAPSARHLADRLAFAPGMAAQLAGYGPLRDAVVERFVANLERDFGAGEVYLGGKAFVGIAEAPR